MLTRLSLKLKDRVRPLELKGSVTDQLAQLQDYINQSEKNKYDQSRAIQKFLDGLNEKGALTISANSLYSSRGLQFPTSQGALVSDPNTLDDYVEGTWTPTVTASSGTITTASAIGAYTKIGNATFFYVQVSITTNGTGSGSVRFTIPSGTLANDCVGHGRAAQVSGKALQTFGGSGNGFINIRNYDDTYPGADGEILRVAGVIRA